MKKAYYLIAALFFFFNSLTAQPTAGVYLFMSHNNITTSAGNAANQHPDEVELLTVQNGFIATGGIPQLSEILFSKRFDLSSLRLQNYSLLGNAGGGAFCEIRYYNGTANTPVYVIRLNTPLITSYTSANSTCTTCPDLTENFSIRPVVIIWRNQAVTPNQILQYNTNTGIITFSNN